MIIFLLTVREMLHLSLLRLSNQSNIKVEGPWLNDVFLSKYICQSISRLISFKIIIYVNSIYIIIWSSIINYYKYACILFRIRYNFFIVLPVRLKTCSSNIFFIFYQEKRFSPQSRSGWPTYPGLPQLRHRYYVRDTYCWHQIHLIIYNMLHNLCNKQKPVMTNYIF